jgi:tripartite-type tricarboxylate transporter receptor subunit TctC
MLMLIRRFALFAFAILFALPGTPRQAAAQGANDWPNKPIRLVIFFPAGSVTDIVARILTVGMGKTLGQQFVIDNRSGASGNIGADILAKSPPDGYTFGMATSSTHGVATTLSANLSYDAIKDFSPVGMIGNSPYVLMVTPSLPVKSVPELIAYSKAKPNSLSFATAGPASLANLAGALFNTLAGTDLSPVPYRTSAQSITDLTEGRIQVQFGTLGPSLPFVYNNKARGLATTGAKRIPQLADLPTVGETLPGYDASLWMAFIAPASTPHDIVVKFNAALNKSLADPEVIELLKVQGVFADPGTPEALGKRIEAEIAKWKEVAQKAGIKPESN